MAHDRFDIARNDVWKTRITERTNPPGDGENPVPFFRQPQQPVTVRVDQTPNEARCTFNANFPRYDWLDVQNLPNRKRV